MKTEAQRCNLLPGGGGGGVGIGTSCAWLQGVGTGPETLKSPLSQALPAENLYFRPLPESPPS